MRNVSNSYELIKNTKANKEGFKRIVFSEKKNVTKNKIQITPTAQHAHKVNINRPRLRHFCYNIKFKFIILHRKKNHKYKLIKRSPLFVYDIQVLLNPR